MKRSILLLSSLFGILMSAALAYIYYTRTPEVTALTHYRATESRVPSAFHTGGFEKGSGGRQLFA